MPDDLSRRALAPRRVGDLPAAPPNGLPSFPGPNGWTAHRSLVRFSSCSPVSVSHGPPELLASPPGNPDPVGEWLVQGCRRSKKPSGMLIALNQSVSDRATHRVSYAAVDTSLTTETNPPNSNRKTEVERPRHAQRYHDDLRGRARYAAPPADEVPCQTRRGAGGAVTIYRHCHFE
jgi:hypothetical protein